MTHRRGGADRKVTDPRPVPTPSVWALLLAIIVPTLYILWVRVAIPVSRRSDELTASEQTSLDVLRIVVQPVALVAIVLGIIGVVIVRRDPHLFRWQWVGFLAIGLGVVELVVYGGAWLGWWPSI